MTDHIWDAYLTSNDKAVLAASGFGATAGFGKRPALLIVDVSWTFTGDKPEPILDSIKRWPASCGAVSWLAIPVIKKLAEAFRAKKLPVIYTTGQSRSDGWDKGSWQFKNSRIQYETVARPNALDGNQIVTDIAPQKQDIVVYKQKPSGFFGTNLASYLTLLGADCVHSLLGRRRRVAFARPFLMRLASTIVSPSSKMDASTVAKSATL